ncbi:spore coat protein CotH [Corynebacterium glutamicum]|uniref:CotH kinase family protein n=1 Tax=Corynebacterium glutamicum TaxID=1718 RepID=UPI0004F73230|nr:CotH kinase family protein [Corynebacterium glutamicum]AIK83802.1 spore coat protein CotH [Corynebacterium glutamicum]AIK86563.1 spore coat protein CotH [Corynebacterium glutamicum]
MNRRLFLGTSAAIIAVGGVLGGVQVVPYISSGEIQTSASSTATIDVGAGNVDIFDTSVSHEISLQVSQESLDEMLADYQEDGSKTWVKATITIDGVTIEDVGIRLKGNSTLSGLSGKSENGIPQGPGGGDFPELSEEEMAQFQEQFAEDTAETGETAETEETRGPGGGMGGGGMGGMTSVDADDVSTWPLLISFDKYEDGRVYQGMTQLALRPGTTVVNEAMALALTAETGQVSQQSSFTTFSLNDEPSTTRLLLEHPDENYADALGNGVLFKADSNSSFTYQGEDQTEYDGQFKQINGDGNGDIQPIINLLKWLDTASDEEFAEHLSDYVDVESFARYVATQNLLVNSDDMAGPGSNYYLWYDYDTGLISVISWDLNLAMSGSTDAGPDDEISMGGGGGGGMRPGGTTATETEGTATEGTTTEGTTTEGTTTEGTTTEGTTTEGTTTEDMPAMGEMPDMENMPDMGDREGGGSMGGNQLKERFLASDAFTEIYEQVYWELYEEMYGSGTAIELLDEIAASIPETDAVTADEIATEVASMREWITARTEALAALQE